MRAERSYRESVCVQRAQDAVEVAWTAPAAWGRWGGRRGTARAQCRGCARDYVDALTGKRHAAVAQAWAREVVGRPEVEAELRTFAAAPQRLGEDGRATWSERLWLADMSRAS